MPDAFSDTDIHSLITESRHPNTLDIDTVSVSEILLRMNAEDKRVASAVETELPAIAKAVDAVTLALRAGGRLIYIGAGTSGRLGVLDASECPPTFSVSADTVVGIMAGGDRALRESVEDAEDNAGQGAIDLAAANVTANDVVVALAVSGRTPYTIGALEYANTLGATTVAVSCNPDSKLSQQASISIAPLVGPEVLSGSTRLKSGTAQKMVLNMLSTAAMIRMGKTYQNLMVDVAISNHKLRARAVGIVAQATGCEADVADSFLVAAGDNVKLAILMQLTGLEYEAAKVLLDARSGFLRDALQASSD